MGIIITNNTISKSPNERTNDIKNILDTNIRKRHRGNKILVKTFSFFSFFLIISLSDSSNFVSWIYPIFEITKDNIDIMTEKYSV